jgi:hypothetical protein
MSDMPVTTAPMQTQRLVDAVKGILPDPGASSGLVMATVQSIDAINQRVTVGWGGSSDPSGPFVYANHCNPIVGQGCYLAPLGNNVWLVVATLGALVTRQGAANVSFVSGNGTLTVSPAFPTAMDGAIVQMSANSVGPASLAISAAAPTSASTILCSLNQVNTSGPYQCWYWAWGH